MSAAARPDPVATTLIGADQREEARTRRDDADAFRS